MISVVFENLKSTVIIQSDPGVVTGEFSILESSYTAVIGADPKCAVGVFVKRTDRATRQPIRFGPARQSVVFDSRQAAIRSDPKTARSAFDDDFYVVSGQSVRYREPCQNTV